MATPNFDSFNGIQIISLDDSEGLEAFEPNPIKSTTGNSQAIKKDIDELEQFMPDKPKYAPLAERQPLFQSYYKITQPRNKLGRFFTAALALLSYSTPHNQTVSTMEREPVPVVRAAYNLGLHESILNDSSTNYLQINLAATKKELDLGKLEIAAQRSGMTGVYTSIYGKQESNINIYKTSEMRQLYDILGKPVFNGRLLNNIEVTKDDVSKIYNQLIKATTKELAIEQISQELENKQQSSIDDIVTPMNVKTSTLEENLNSLLQTPGISRNDHIYNAARNGAIKERKTLKNGKQIFVYDNNEIARIAETYGLSQKYTKHLVRNSALMNYL